MLGYVSATAASVFAAGRGRIDEGLIDRLMSILTDETATDAQRDAAAVAAAPFFHDEVNLVEEWGSSQLACEHTPMPWRTCSRIRLRKRILKMSKHQIIRLVQALDDLEVQFTERLAACRASLDKLKKACKEERLRAHKALARKRNSNLKWKKKDEVFLEAHAMHWSVGTIAKHLNRSVSAVRTKANAMGIPSMRKLPKAKRLALVASTQR